MHGWPVLLAPAPALPMPPCAPHLSHTCRLPTHHLPSNRPPCRDLNARVLKRDIDWVFLEVGGRGGVIQPIRGNGPGGAEWGLMGGHEGRGAAPDCWRLAMRCCYGIFPIPESAACVHALNPSLPLAPPLHNCRRCMPRARRSMLRLATMLC